MRDGLLRVEASDVGGFLGNGVGVEDHGVLEVGSRVRPS